MISKTIVLKDGARVTYAISSLRRRSAIAFFQRIPENERWYLRHDVSNAKRFDTGRWRSIMNRSFRSLRLRMSKLSATPHSTAILWQQRHVGKVRIVIDPIARGNVLAPGCADLIQLATALV